MDSRRPANRARDLSRGGRRTIILSLSLAWLAFACDSPVTRHRAPVVADAQRRLLAPELAFLPRDTQAAFRWRPAAAGPLLFALWRQKAAELFANVPGCTPDLLDQLDDLIVGIRPGFEGDRGMRALVLRATGRFSRPAIRSCLEAYGEILGTFRVAESGAALLVEDLRGAEILSIDWIESGILAAPRAAMGNQSGPGDRMRELFAQMDPESSIWAAMSIPKRDGEVDDKADVDGGWLTLRWEREALHVRFAAHLVGGKTLDSWLDDVTAILLQISALKGIAIDPKTIRARMLTSRRDRWNQVELSWTGAELNELLRQADAATAPSPSPPSVPPDPDLAPSEP